MSHNTHVSPVNPVVVIVGRPNVGKSTLFNRLTRSRRALVHDQPGVTRDRIIGDARAPGGGMVTLVDTGGFLLTDEDQFIPLIRSQAETALASCDAVLFLLDGETGPIPEDVEISKVLRSLDRPVVVAVNKSDRKGTELQAHEFFRLGLGEPVLISAEHGIGMSELWEALEPHLELDAQGDAAAQPRPRREGIHVAIIGRPNVGKSSLLNQLVGASRSIVSETPGTTRDAVDVVLENDGQRFVFVDTAGIRRKGKTDRGPEVLSVVMARRHLERADLCLLVVDVCEGVTRQDAHVGGYAWQARRAVAVVFNKWDLVEDREAKRQALEDGVLEHLKFVRHAPRLFLSALTGRGVQRLYPAMCGLHQAFSRKTSTSELNQLLRDAWQRHPPAAAGRVEPKLYYAVQDRHAPPRFVLFTNLRQDPHITYLRYLENTLRSAYGLDGVPIRVMIKGREH